MFAHYMLLIVFYYYVMKIQAIKRFFKKKGKTRLPHVFVYVIFSVSRTEWNRKEK